MDTITKIARTLNDPNGIYWRYINSQVPMKWREDLQQEMMCILFANQEKLIKAYDEGWMHCLYFNIMEKQWKSGTSPFYKKYKKSNLFIVIPEIPIGVEEYETLVQGTVHLDQEEDLAFKQLREEQNNALNIALSKTHLSWYENELYKLFYLQNRSTRQIATEFEINHVGVWKAIKAIDQKIRNNLPTLN